MVTVTGVEKGSAAQKAGILSGDILLSVNGRNICDVLDYRFAIADEKLEILLHRGPELVTAKIRKEVYDDIGLDFSTPLMDEKKQCSNRCIFCFIDQNPPGMRESIYFKDDDRRLSFLQGSYITLTNLSEDDVARIIEMRTSPLRVSVHTTEPELRVRMLANKNAGSSLDLLKRFAEAGISLECQIVLCRGVNDGEHLVQTMRDLYALSPAVESVSIVPAGLTKHRKGLYPLVQFLPKEAEKVIETVDAFAEKCREETGTRVFYCADELYLLAGKELPGEEYYDGYPQIENGVGLITSMAEEIRYELSEHASEYRKAVPEKTAIATGTAAYPFICGFVERAKKAIPSLETEIFPIRNDFFGESITVAGLVTGNDIIRQLKGRITAKTLLLPAVMLRAERDRFLDDVTVEELENALGVQVRFADNDGADFLSCLFGL